MFHRKASFNRKGQILFCKINRADSDKKFPETDIIKMPEFLLDNIFDMFGGRIFLQTIVIPMGIDLLHSLSTSFTRDKLHAGAYQ